MSLRALGRPGRRAHLGVFGGPTAPDPHRGVELALADRISPAQAILAANLGVKASAIRCLRPEELVVEPALSEVPALADKAAAHLGARLVSLFASDQRVWNGRFLLHHVWSLPGLETFLRVSAGVDPLRAVFPSIAAKHPAARWFEREVADRFGLTPEGDPHPKRVDAATLPGVKDGFHPFRPVMGEGVFQVPVRALQAGIIEPGHFRFGVAGEPESYRQLRLFYVHQGIEKRFERLSWRDGLFVAESVSGDTAVGHALAYAHAIERLAGVDVPARARALRVVLLELERIYNHVADIVAFATNRSLTGCASRALAMREGLARHLERLFVTRLLRGTVALGGVKHDLSPVGRDDLLSCVRAFEAEFEQLVTLVIDAGSFTDRVDGTVILTNTVARELGMVGMAARASGIDADLRRDHPHDGYDGLRFEVPVEETGDVRARLMLRAREVKQSHSIVRQVLETLRDTPLLARLPDDLPAFSSALGWAEAWRGPCFHWIATDERGGLSRVKVTDASSFNWPGLVEAVPGGIVSDVPVINGSNLPYSGDDR
jgi:Ni,Fe-hydrogenase III large subunit